VVTGYVVLGLLPLAASVPREMSQPAPPATSYTREETLDGARPRLRLTTLPSHRSIICVANAHGPL
jgi:hypothetical protein